MKAAAVPAVSSMNERTPLMELDIKSLDMLPASVESSLRPCNGITCLDYLSCATFTCGSTAL